jgi:hypothetical protein
MMLALALLLLAQKEESLGDVPPGPPPKQAPQKQTPEQAKFHPGMAPPTSADMKTTDEQKCQMECSRKMQECMAPAAPKNPEDNNEQKRHEFMVSMQSCMQKSQPCIQACAKKNAKKDKKDAAAAPPADKAATP